MPNVMLPAARTCLKDEMLLVYFRYQGGTMADTPMKLILLFLVFVIAGLSPDQKQPIYAINSGIAHFRSDAPLEMIEAESKELKGLIDFEQETFAFSISINSFRGFNSALQREHFNENYMETEKFARATFAGKLIEKIDISQPGQYTVRAKGKLNIHGVEQERIIPVTLTIQNQQILIHSTFNVILQDHNIAIPKVVQQKIADTIIVHITAKAESK
jgi:polyisoprenoid-binding protein YceI